MSLPFRPNPGAAGLESKGLLRQLGIMRTFLCVLLGLIGSATCDHAFAAEPPKFVMTVFGKRYVTQVDRDALIAAPKWMVDGKEACPVTMAEVAGAALRAFNAAIPDVPAFLIDRIELRPGHEGGAWFFLVRAVCSGKHGPTSGTVQYGACIVYLDGSTEPIEPIGEGSKE